MSHSQAPDTLDIEGSVRERYSNGAQEREAALCCPVDYDARYLEIIPQEVLERDYGCGDPSSYVRPGETVLDLGSGGGKICFIAAQIVGPEGRVIGVDMNDDMLELARSNSPKVAEALGYDNVEFRRGRIQDLALDLDRVETWLKTHPVHDALSLSTFEDFTDQVRRKNTLIPDNSVDIVVSNCVLNLVRESDKPQLIQEIHRVLKPGGRIALSDIVSDEVIPEALRADATLWSGCISGAFHEKELLSELENAGFRGIALDKWESEPWQTVEGIEFRSVTVTGVKGHARPGLEANQALIYKGPWKSVEDDDGHVLRRGERVAVCDRTFDQLTGEPYGDSVIGIAPRVAIPQEQRVLFDCQRSEARDPRESKGNDYVATTETAEDCCGVSTTPDTGESCC